MKASHGALLIASSIDGNDILLFLWPAFGGALKQNLLRGSLYSHTLAD